MKRLRAIAFWAHLVAGTAAGLVILVLSLTGAALAFKPQMLRALDTGAFQVAPSGRQPLAASALIAAIQQARPSESVRAVTLQRDPGSPASAQVGSSTLYLDPYTGAVLGEASARAQQAFRSIENWHRWLAMSSEGRDTGRAVTGVANVALLFLALSGIYLWWPRSWSLKHLRPILWFRRSGTGRARDFNWHNVVGFWAAPMIVVMTATGAVMSYPSLNGVLLQITGGTASQGGGQGSERGRAGQESMPARQGRGAVGPNSAAERRSDASASVDDAVIDTAVATGAERRPAWRTLNVEMPRSSGAPLSVTLSEGASTPAARSQLVVDSTTGAVVRWQPPTAASLSQRVRTWVRFAHTGEQWGVVGQSAAAIACLVSVLLIWTGLSLAARRLVNALQRVRAARVAGGRSARAVSPLQGGAPRVITGAGLSPRA